MQATKTPLSVSTLSVGSLEERRTLFAHPASAPIPANALAVNAEIAEQSRLRRSKRQSRLISVLLVLLMIVAIIACVCAVTVYLSRRMQGGGKMRAGTLKSQRAKRVLFAGKKGKAPKGLWRLGSDGEWYYYSLVGPARSMHRRTIREDTSGSKKPARLQKKQQT